MKTQQKIIYALLGIGVFLPFILMEAKETSTKFLFMWATVGILVAVIAVGWTDLEYRARLKQYYWVPIVAGLLLYGLGRLLLPSN
ncbi:MAG TPA: hypothetical protein VG737_08660 [Cyclobacteriaceae bacterium]|nr:hypothetical protein [Cyclobacteriaceae bacterium]